MNLSDVVWTVYRLLKVSAQASFVFVLLYILYGIVTQERPHKHLPVASIERKGIKRFLPARLTWISQAQDLLETGLQQFPSCFQVPTLTGYKIIVPRRFADEIKSNPHMNINKFWSRELCIEYPGFEAPRMLFSNDTFISGIVKNKLTRSLGLVINDLIDEMNASVRDVWSESHDWHERPVKEDVQAMVARLTSRVFLGKDLCRDPGWVEVSRGYTITMFIAANQLRIVPGPLRPFAHRFLPACRKIQQQVAITRHLIMPEVERRRRLAEQTLAAGEKTSKVSDAIGWMVEAAEGRSIDYVASQLALTVAAIHTTTETVVRCLVQLSRSPEIVTPLRDEAVRVLSEHGWSNTALNQMKLIDSFLKEVQRMHALARAPMKRLVETAVTLSDGTVLPKGSRILVCDNGRTDPDVYDQPEQFRADRFLRLREEGKETEYQFVSTSADHMTFGYGQHACPGRWFASNEIKILLTFVLLQYEFKPARDKNLPWIVDFGDGRYVNPQLKLEVRRRHEEIDLIRPERKAR